MLLEISATRIDVAMGVNEMSVGNIKEALQNILIEDSSFKQTNKNRATNIDEFILAVWRKREPYTFSRIAQR